MRRLSDAAELRAALPALFAPVAHCRCIGLAVSGGADSLALLLLARDWAAGLEMPPRLIVYSVDHGLRPEAAGEAADVVCEAERLGLAARALRWAGTKPASGVQAAARTARYRLMGEAMRADGAEILLTAHHRDDQAETVLMRLAHGSGLEGLRGMAAFSTVERVAVFRPLLDIAPEALGAIVQEAGLIPAADPSNADRHYERVRWRQEVPRLNELGLDGARLSRFARRAGEAEVALGQWTDAQFAALVRFDRLGAAALPGAAFAALPRAIGVKLLARLLERTGGSGRKRALGAVERLHDRLTGGAPFQGMTMLGASIRRRGETLWFSREPGRQEGTAAIVEPAATLLWDGRFRITNNSSLPFEVRMAREFSRQAAERLLGQRLDAPASAIRSAPLVSASGGEVRAFGAFRLSEGVAVELAE